jgi:hypothetical protein
MECWLKDAPLQSRLTARTLKVLMQHVITIVKTRVTRDGLTFIRRLQGDFTTPILDQAKSKWLLYWAQYYDPWLSSFDYSDVPSKPLTEKLIEISDYGACERWLTKRLKRKYQWPETKWYHQHLIDALLAYKGQCRSRLFVHNRCTNSSLGDNELFDIPGMRASPKANP